MTSKQTRTEIMMGDLLYQYGLLVSYVMANSSSVLPMLLRNNRTTPTTFKPYRVYYAMIMIDWSHQ